jgi:pimeloyl-ACP methyl ester carboxylesterase
MKSGTFKHDGVIFHYDIAGEGEKHVMLQHGLSDFALCWGNMISDLSRNSYKIIMMDARGHGRSGKPDYGYNLDTMTGDMVAFVRYLNLNKPVIIGHSLGASMTARAAAAFPDELRATILIDPVFSDFSTEELRKNIQDRKLTYREMKKMSHDEIREYTLLKHPTWDAVYINSYVLSRVYTLAADQIFDIQETVDKGWREDLKAINCPIMLITADKEKGALIGQDTTNWIHETYPKIEILHVPNVGHNPHRENYPLVLGEISKFLEKQFASQ